MNHIPRIVVGAFFSASCIGCAYAQASSQSYDMSHSKTRVEVQADLRDWLAAGYNPMLDWLLYPQNAIEAGRIVAQRRAQGASGASIQQ